MIKGKLNKMLISEVCNYQTTVVALKVNRYLRSSSQFNVGDPCIRLYPWKCSECLEKQYIIRRQWPIKGRPGRSGPRPALSGYGNLFVEN